MRWLCLGALALVVSCAAPAELGKRHAPSQLATPLPTPDFDSYVATQREAGEEYLDQALWTRKAILNVARVGRFSSDRSVREYAAEVWGVEPGGPKPPAKKKAKRKKAKKVSAKRKQA